MTAIAIAPRYEPPQVFWAGEPATEQRWIWWVIYVLTYAAALAWAAYCISRGGEPSISWEWWRFKITCNRWGNT